MASEMKRYRIKYKDKFDPAAPEFPMVVRGYDREHAEQRFYESGEDDEWTIVSTTLIRESKCPAPCRPTA